MRRKQASHWQLQVLLLHLLHWVWGLLDSSYLKALPSKSLKQTAGQSPLTFRPKIFWHGNLQLRKRAFLGIKWLISSKILAIRLAMQFSTNQAKLLMH
ncbi:Uncharacterised protein [Enterobacter hormaechei]|nr:Uncharacterised protein [Enterobacter hormaechei]